MYTLAATCSYPSTTSKRYIYTHSIVSFSSLLVAACDIAFSSSKLVINYNIDGFNGGSH